MAIAAIAAGFVLLASGIGIGWTLSGHDVGGSTAVEAPLVPVPQTVPSAGGQGGSTDTGAIAGKVTPGVVDINTVIQGLSSNGEAAGTGMILTSSGQVLTNNHVIAGSSSIKVTLPSQGRSYTATVVGADPSDDVALLQLQGASGLPTVTLADSSSSTVGQRIVALGNALGRGGSPSVTTGTITALGQSITVGSGNGKTEHLNHLIQMDAPISPGDSGGPIVNVSGQVLGIITASDANGRFQETSHVGFAIPANDAGGIVNEVRAGHASSTIILGQPGFLGVAIQDLDPATAAQLGLGAGSGVLVAGVVPGSPAAKVGITEGAAITVVDGHRISSADALGPTIYTHKPGESIRVTWVDQNGTHTAAASLIAGPAV